MRAQTVYKTAYVFDFDECIVTTTAKINIFRNGAHWASLTSKEYNDYKHKDGDKLDFSEFNDGEKILKAKPYKAWYAIKNISDIIKRGNNTAALYILTARSLQVRPYIYKFLKSHGIEIDLENILTIGDSVGAISISDEKRKALTALKNEYDHVLFYDDDPKNIAIAKSVPGVEAKLVESKIINDMKLVRTSLDEDAMGGVSAPMATVNNVPGVGNPTPAGVNQIGSGDKWSTSKKPYTQTATPKKKKKKLEEENINPYDKIGMAMAKKMKVKPPFKKGKESGNQNSVKTAKFEHEIMPYNQFMNEEQQSPEAWKAELFRFLDHPWQEDIEIDFISLLDQYRRQFESTSKSFIQDYLKRMDKMNGSKLFNCSDAFLGAWDDLLK